MRTHKFILGVAAASIMLVGGHAQAGVYFDVDNPYLSADDSPFATIPANTGGWFVEDFEDDNYLEGLTFTGGTVRAPGMYTDSVDADDVLGIDGWGSQGGSYGAGGSSEGHSFTFVFDPSVLGGLPMYAGLVWTDGQLDVEVNVRAFDAEGIMVGELQTFDLGEAGRRGETGEDRFIGFSSLTGIASIVITSSSGALEVDHVQYAAVIPLPAPLALGLAGLGMVALVRRRRSVA
jgi:MYXO-CTERM domain-containing protein